MLKSVLASGTAVSDAGSPLSVGDQAVAGIGAGFAGALIACPTELIKCRLQAQANTKPKASAKPVGLAMLSQSDKGLAHLVQAGTQARTNTHGTSVQPQAAARQQAAVGLASMGQGGRGLAGLVQPGATAHGFSTLQYAIATSGTTPGALHLGEITVSPALHSPPTLLQTHDVCPSVRLFVCLPARLLVCLSVCLSVWPCCSNAQGH